VLFCRLAGEWKDRGGNLKGFLDRLPHSLAELARQGLAQALAAKNAEAGAGEGCAPTGEAPPPQAVPLTEV
jgi:hypothetical protein